MVKSPIPFNRPTRTGNELTLIHDVLANGHLAGDGHFTRQCSALLEEQLGTPKALLTTSCTHALEMCALLLDIAPGDEVIVPSFGFVTTVSAFVLRGAVPVFVDVRPDTLNIDEAQIQCRISPRTKAIVTLHYAGIGCEMDAILPLAREQGIAVVEDNALGLFAKYKGRFLGTFGCLATQSFHETKNFVCGEGGALLINDDTLIERAEIIREKGTNRARFFRGQVDKYTWVDLGSSYLPSDLLAAVLYAQLEQRSVIQRQRERVWLRYNQSIADWAEGNAFTMPHIPDYCEQSFHMFFLRAPSLDVRQAFITHLETKGVQAVFHYLPLHLSEMGRRYGAQPGDCPITEDASDRLVRLPLFTAMTDLEQATVIDAVTGFRS